MTQDEHQEKSEQIGSVTLLLNISLSSSFFDPYAGQATEGPKELSPSTRHSTQRQGMHGRIPSKPQAPPHRIGSSGDKHMGFLYGYGS